MNVIKPGKVKSSTKPRKLQGEEATMEDIKAVAKTKPKEEQDIPSKIEVRHATGIGAVVPGHVWRTRPFKWQPVTFVTESEQLNSKFIEPHVQDSSMLMFLNDPTKRMIYGVSGAPDDSKAKYFAAYLVAHHMKALGADANVMWNPVYGGFGNPLMDREGAAPTMLVLTNLTPNATNTKLEKARDLIEKFCDIPRIIVIAGMDPLSFLATRMYTPCHGLAYFSEALVKQRVEVI